MARENLQGQLWTQGFNEWWTAFIAKNFSQALKAISYLRQVETSTPSPLPNAHNHGDLPNAVKEFGIVGKMEQMDAATLDQLVPRELFGELADVKLKYYRSLPQPPDARTPSEYESKLSCCALAHEVYFVGGMKEEKRKQQENALISSDNVSFNLASSITVNSRSIRTRDVKV
ncbi:hypothetical protein NA56DRAFT_705517 [Hyaloscypha hepaticicola]|uniref:Uncharacterized protein n=1 Tax=Hyaloscypha hepaticicola TaxID=2082293 RepID=A0A2J6PZ81_9HELO|nr:hypothetical protein NA56DRAFT_705517 [Hyaloscypha hepaticicola]